MSALEVFTANDVTVLVDSRGGYTPTPAVSRAILAYNASKPAHRADGVVVTPSHNPPPDGGFKYNPPDGGPAGTEITGWIQDRANELLAAGLDGVRRIPYARARADRARLRLPGRLRRTRCRASSTSTRSGRPACASAPTRSAGRPSRTGARSASATAST